MSGPRWDPAMALNPQATITEKLLYWTRMALQQRVDAEVLFRAGDISVIGDKVANQVVIEANRMVLTDRVLSVVEEVPCEVSLPWSCSVMLCVPNGRWRRLLRLPERQIWHDVGGRVKAYGVVRVKLDHLVMFPNPKRAFPEELGRPVRYQQLDFDDVPTFGRFETRRDGRYAAEHGE